MDRVLSFLSPGLETNPRQERMIADVMLPGMDGLEVCRRIREKSRIPVIMLTAKGDEADRVVGLELGADDYVPKPFSPRELLARLRAVLRRSQPEALHREITVGDLHIDTDTRVVRRGASAIDLTGLEFDILVALARRPGRVIPREALLDEAGRADVSVGDRTVDVHVSHLRRKLGDDPRSPRLLKTVRGVGYLLTRGRGAAPPEPADAAEERGPQASLGLGLALVARIARAHGGSGYSQ